MKIPSGRMSVVSSEPPTARGKAIRVTEGKAGNIASVPSRGLCTMCGTCVSVCPEGAVRMDWRFHGVPEPVVDDKACTSCGRCVRTCPGPGVDLSAYWGGDGTGGLTFSEECGPFRSIRRMRSEDPEVGDAGVSGGMVTAFLGHLFAGKEIDGAMVTVADPDDPMRCRTLVAKDPAQLRPSQDSRYQPNPHNQALGKLLLPDPEIGSRLAFVGLPCHVEALRLVQAECPGLGERVPWALSLFCSRTPSLAATRYLLSCSGVAAEQVKSIRYRSGSHPGHLAILLRDGGEVRVPHLDRRYWGFAFSDFFIPPRCYMCPDKTGELSDVSFGDNWQRMGSEHRGASTVIARSEKAERVLEEMARRGGAGGAMTLEELIADQDLARKRSMGNRFFLARAAGLGTPDFNRSYPVRPSFFLRDARLLRHVLLARKGMSVGFWKAYIDLSWIKTSVLSFLAKACRRLWRGFRTVLRLSWALPRALTFRRVPFGPRADVPKVVVIGGFGWRDIGDEAMPRADLLNLRERIPNLDVVMLSADPAYTSEYHGERSVPDLKGMSFAGRPTLREMPGVLARTILFLAGAWFSRRGMQLRLWSNARAVLDELMTAHLVFNVGGGNLNSVIPFELYKKCTTYLAARLMGIPVLVSGQTIGPFTRWMDRYYARLCLDTVRMVTFRDRGISAGRMADLGVRRPVMADAADDAVTLPGLPREEALDLLARSVPEAWLNLPCRMTVAMNLKGSLRVFKGEGRSGSMAGEVALMGAVADAVCEHFDARVFFLPTDYAPSVDDRVLHREILGLMAHRDRACAVEEEYVDSQLKGLLSLADAAIGARYHFCVFSSSEGVPFLGMASGVYQQTKLKGLSALCELPQCYLPDDMEKARFEDVWPRVKAFLEDLAAIRRQLHRVVPGLKQRSLTCVNEAVRLLESRAGVQGKAVTP